MRERSRLFALAILSAISVNIATAQITAFSDNTLVPANPTSVDNLKLSLVDRTCGGGLRYKDNFYNVAMVQNNITVRLGERLNGVFSICPPTAREEIDLGRLPPGNYTLTVIDFPGNPRITPLPTNLSFTVTDARAPKAAPYVRLDYSGTWWDASDPGWGLFIWQDANKPADTIFAAWFTFTPDGKSAWYTFQPTWATTSTTAEAPLVQAARLPGASNPPAGANINTQVGTASLDFTTLGGGDEGKLTYTLGTGAKQVRTIKRFKP